MPVARYVKNTVVVRAIKWDGQDLDKIKDFVGGDLEIMVSNGNEILISTSTATICTSRGDWIIQGINGEFYPCKDDVFVNSYTKVEEVNNETKDYAS